jgi:hypothetical protein
VREAIEAVLTLDNEEGELEAAVHVLLDAAAKGEEIERLDDAHSTLLAQNDLGEADALADRVASWLTRVRRAARPNEELLARCGVFNETGHGTSENAPEGWVEIQAFDSIDREFGSRTVEPFAQDEDAAVAVAAAGGAPGTAMFYETVSGLFEPIPLDGLAVNAERWDAMDLMASTLRKGRGARHWICIVPRSVAKAAGLLGGE